MTLPPPHSAGPSRRRLLALGGFGLTAWLVGCASQPGLGDSLQELQTASDETDARRRARTRLALATGYYENGQHTVALDEQKKALQIDPGFGEAYNLGGLIYMALGDNALAISNFQRAIALTRATATPCTTWAGCTARPGATTTPRRPSSAPSPCPPTRTAPRP